MRDNPGPIRGAKLSDAGSNYSSNSELPMSSKFEQHKQPLTHNTDFDGYPMSFCFCFLLLAYELSSLILILDKPVWTSVTLEMGCFAKFKHNFF